MRKPVDSIHQRHVLVSMLLQECEYHVTTDEDYTFLMNIIVSLLTLPDPALYRYLYGVYTTQLNRIPDNVAARLDAFCHFISMSELSPHASPEDFETVQVRGTQTTRESVGERWVGRENPRIENYVHNGAGVPGMLIHLLLLNR